MAMYFIQTAVTCPKVPVKYSDFTPKDLLAYSASINMLGGASPLPQWWYLAASLFHSSPVVCLCCSAPLNSDCVMVLP